MSVYRCAKCRHGKHLTAWGAATVHGTLGADGEIDTIDYDDVYEVHESSIQCSTHPGGVIEKRVGDRWCRWWVCSWCGGDGQRSACDYVSTHQGWRPVGEEPPPLPLGPGHVLDVPAGKPMSYGTCRLCMCAASSISGGQPCRGEQAAAS